MEHHGTSENRRRSEAAETPGGLAAEAAGRDAKWKERAVKPCALGGDTAHSNQKLMGAG